MSFSLAQQKHNDHFIMGELEVWETKKMDWWFSCRKCERMMRNLYEIFILRFTIIPPRNGELWVTSTQLIYTTSSKSHFIFFSFSTILTSNSAEYLSNHFRSLSLQNRQNIIGKFRETNEKNNLGKFVIKFLIYWNCLKKIHQNGASERK